MYYSGYFRNTDTSTDEAGQLFKVVIITNFKNNEYNYGGELMLSDSPFVVNYESEEGNIFKPYKCSTATVGLLQKEYNFEFNNTSGNNVLVALLRFKNGKQESEVTDNDLNGTLYSRQLQIDNYCYTVEWIGYATPNTYSQSYEDLYDEFELECQDAISTLQYFPYKITNVKSTYISFIDILKNCCQFLRTYKNIYISDTLRLPTQSEGDIMNFCYVDQRNFYDEDEKPKSYLEVLEQLALYLNLTIVPYGDSLYILEYNGIRNGFNSYYHYKYLLENYFIFIRNINVVGFNKFGLQKNKVKLESSYDIKPEDFSSNGTKLSLLSSYNKMSVKDSLYSYDTISPDFSDSDRWEESSIYDLVGRFDNQNLIVESGGRYVSEVFSAQGVVENVQMAEWVDGGFTPNKRADEDKYLTVIGNTRKGNQKVYIKFLKFKDTDSILNNTNLETFWYETETLGTDGLLFEVGKEMPSINENNEYSYNNLRSHTGAQFIAYSVESIKDGEDKSKHPEKLELKPAIIISTPSNLTLLKDFNSMNQNNLTLANQPMFKIHSKCICVGSGDYFLISFKMKCYKDSDCLPINVDSTDNAQEDTFQRIGIAFNGYEYEANFVTGKLTQPYYFETKNKKAFGTELEFKKYLNPLEENPTTLYNFKDKLGIDSGILIPTRMFDTENSAEVCDITLTFYRPFGATKDTPVKYTLIEDFEIKVITKSDLNGLNSSNDDTDTEYTNEIDSDSIVEKSNLELDISTWDSKQLNYSSVVYNEKLNDSGKNLFGIDTKRVRHIYNSSTGEILRPEEHIINNNINQYSTPTLNLNLNLHLKPLPYSVFTYHFFKDKSFIVDSCEYDYVNNSYNINLMEKK